MLMFGSTETDKLTFSLRQNENNPFLFYFHLSRYLLNIDYCLVTRLVSFYPKDGANKE